MHAALAVAVGLLAAGVEPRLLGVEDLHRSYYAVFGPHGNRNAASHLWSSFVLERAAQMDAKALVEVMSGFCGVSGSIVRPSDYNRYRLTLPTVDGGTARGFMHYCCWPCICDSHDFFKVDYKTVRTADGPNRYAFVVLGDPCVHEALLDVPFVQPFGYRTTTLRREASAVECIDGRLKGATFSDGGFVIVAMFFDADATSSGGKERHAAHEGLVSASHTPTPGRLTRDGSGRLFQDEIEYGPMCQQRADKGYNSGMGEIFRKVAAITPVRPQRRLLEGGEAAGAGGADVHQVQLGAAAAQDEVTPAADYV